jgi:hypothetical protein
LIDVLSERGNHASQILVRKQTHDRDDSAVLLQRFERTRKRVGGGRVMRSATRFLWSRGH